MSKPRRCPKCGSSNVDYSQIVFTDKQNTSILANGYCYVCKAHFREWHDTVFKGSELYSYNPYDGPIGAPVSYPEEE